MNDRDPARLEHPGAGDSRGNADVAAECLGGGAAEQRADPGQGECHSQPCRADAQLEERGWHVDGDEYGVEQEPAVRGECEWAQGGVPVDPSGTFAQVGQDRPGDRARRKVGDGGGSVEH